MNAPFVLVVIIIALMASDPMPSLWSAWRKAFTNGERASPLSPIFLYGSCANDLGDIWPNYHGIKPPFEIISLYEWLWEKIQSGAKDLACYCPGCYLQLRGATKKADTKIHFTSEDILWAFGDDYPVPLDERAAMQSRLFIDKVKAIAPP